MNSLSVTTSLLTHSLAWALLYSLWQGLLIYGSLYMILKAAPAMNARIKYYLSYGSVTAIFLWFSDTWFTEYEKLKGITVYITRPGTDMIAGETYAAKAVGSENLQNPLLHHYLPGIEHYFPILVTLYITGLSFMMFRFMINIMQVSNLRKHGIAVPDAQWTGFVAQWQRKFDISRPVRLLLSDRIDVPMMLGSIKPVILLPIATMSQLSVEQLEAILLHELAHIRRHDYLLNIVLTIIETVLFFNPFVWLISRIAKREREHCCDDLVIAYSANPLPYAKALAILEDSRRKETTLALAASGQKNQLFNRIKRIMEMKKSNVNYSRLTIIVVAIIAITFTIAMFTFTPSFAQKKKEDSADTTAQKKKTVYKYKSVTIDKNGKRTETIKESPAPARNKAKIIEDGNDNDVNVDVVVNDGDDKDGNKSKTKSYSYSYSYSSDDLKDAINDVISITKDAMASVDLNELKQEMENAKKEMDNIDWHEIKAEIDNGIDEVNKELNGDKMKKEINVQIKKELEHTKSELEKAKKEVDKTRRMHVTAYANGSGKSSSVTVVTNGDDDDYDVQVPDVPPVPAIPPIPPMPAIPPVPPMPPVTATPHVYEGSNDMDGMLNRMEQDGLIDRDRNFKIEKDGDELYINGEKQPAVICNRYLHYMRGNHVKIKGHKGSLSIAINNEN